ncbi:membrane-associated progesterone-binding protein 4 [Phtheirospermum japonicum]|uniref:Membrane-associated progesterone-binding protein 4 n=1 Tax=Phtheirospermum japonicum TaxID=374723 RepID=A0A830CS35_9LAMI|nr:membrane-associated progesterone-binding protein 4 [Phtheirospermum japonicum]
MAVAEIGYSDEKNKMLCLEERNYVPQEILANHHHHGELQVLVQWKGMPVEWQKLLAFRYISVNFSLLYAGDGLTDNLHGLSSPEFLNFRLCTEDVVLTVLLVSNGSIWSIIPRLLNRRFVGKLVGRYYDGEGNPTKYLKGVEAKAARGSQLLEKQKNEEAKVASCNSKWSQEDGSEVWCDEGYPRLVQRSLEIALTGKMSKRCACFKEDELSQSGLEVYEGCDYLAKKCRL